MESYGSFSVQPDAPIGIFDSGIGGMTVADAIRYRMPEESLLYFGDTAHLPYGDKSPASIRHYASFITRLLFDEGCKAVVIACNTASSYAHGDLQREFSGKAPVISVIEPVAEYVAEHYSRRKIGLIGTKGTVGSRVYVRRIKRAAPQVRIASRATPLLAPMIEEGFFDNTISRTIIASYLAKKNFEDIEALVLGCTHYPLIKEEIGEYYQGRVRVIDPSVLVAQRLEERLDDKGLRKRPEDPSPSHRFFVSDLTEAFENSTRLFFGNKVPLKEWRIWEDHSLYQDA
ncbi:MAG: glutamate racemase [Flavobacteriales bacterium]